MAAPVDNLPEDPEAHKALVLAQQDARILALQEQFNLLLANRYGPSSEKADSSQLGLFNEAEAASAEDGTPAAGGEPVSVPAHDRKRLGREPLPEYIEWVEIVHDLPEAENRCPHDGQVLVRIGEEVSEQLDVIPAHFDYINSVGMEEHIDKE